MLLHDITYRTFAASGLAQAVYFAKAKDIHSAFNETLVRWNGAVFILSLVTNVVVTSLIAARIWCVSSSRHFVSID